MANTNYQRTADDVREREGRLEAQLAIHIGTLHRNWILDRYSSDGTRITWLAEHYDQAFADGYRAEIVKRGELLRMVSRPRPSKVTISDAYTPNHGTRPRGQGVWAFSSSSCPTNDHIFYAPDGLTPAEAKKAARAHFAERGVAKVWLLP